MNNDIWSTIFYECINTESFYIVTLFDKKEGIILTQNIATKYSVIDVIYDLTDSVLKHNYTRKVFDLIDNKINSTKYYLHDICYIDKEEINDKNLCIFVKETRIHI